MNYIPSVNIETGITKDFNYIVTPNVQAVMGQIVNCWQSGMHSFTIIGTYGTGKSSFLMALERDLQNETQCIIETRNIFQNQIEEYDFVNVLGDYSSMCRLLGEKLKVTESDSPKAVLQALNDKYRQSAARNRMLVIVVDEFGKVLEHAAKNNPEEELYFLQRLAEVCNDNQKNILLLTTLHQNFNTYAHKLDDAQKQEWQKVKGRFKDVVFSEPIEQLLFLAAEQIGRNKRKIRSEANLVDLLAAAKRSKFVNENFSSDMARSLYPLDPLAAMCLTQAIQRYGQNERTLFSFLTAQGKGALSEFEPEETLLYNLSDVYDYVTYTFFSTLSEANADSMNWSSMRESIERLSSGILSPMQTEKAMRIVKSIGLMNLFGGSSVRISREMLQLYCELALDIEKPEPLIKKLEQFKLIRYAEYKHQFILFEGTDIDIENSLLIADTKVAKPTASVQELNEFIESRAVPAVAEYYKKGTPRYFEYLTENEPTMVVPKDDIDGTIHLVFPLSDMTFHKIKEISASSPNADIYVYFKNVDEIIKHLHQIKKLQYLISNIVLDDRVAKKEVNNLLEFERQQLNESLNSSLVSGGNNVIWIFKGQVLKVEEQGSLKRLVSSVCAQVYSKTPVLRNELFNRQKISSAISLARVNLLDALLEHSAEKDLGFDSNTFPPEKTIYYSLLKSTGLHRSIEGLDGDYIFGRPNSSIKDLWEASEAFLQSSIEKPKKVGELIKTLKSAPFKLKQGVLDFWIPIFLFIKQQDFALYNADDVFVMKITKEVFELLQKHPNDFSVKAFEIKGIKMEYFHQYRKLLRGSSLDDPLTAQTFVQTIKPFFGFFRGLNEYAKTTRKFDHPETARFRDVLARAKDPEKAFFVDLPEALGLRPEELLAGDELTKRVQTSMKELQNCYECLIDRIEGYLTKSLDLPQEYTAMKFELEHRYSSVKVGLLTQKNRIFWERVLAPSESRREFWEKLSNAVLDKRLEQIKDKEEERLIDDILYMFRQLNRFVDISKLDNFNENEEAYSFELASARGEAHKQQTYRLSESQIKAAQKIEQQLSECLTGDTDLDICVLLRLLNEKLGK